MSAGDNSIRNFKTAIRERLAVDHNFFDSEAGQANVGAHKWVTLIVQTSTPASAAGVGIVYTKTVSGVVELFYIDSAGTGGGKQITTGGKLNMALADLSNVTLTSLADGDVLKYDSASGKWVNSKPYAVYK
jgi:hypothetical protein